MKNGHSSEKLDWLKKGDFLLLTMAYKDAIKAGKKDFTVPLSGFEGSPESRTHISQFVVDKGLTYKSDGLNWVFHIS